MLKKLVIKSVLEFGGYSLLDERENIISLSFQFYDLPRLEVGDEIFIDEKLLNKNSPDFTQPYSFVKSSEDEIVNSNVPLQEIGAIKCKKDKFLMRRLFG